jgi:DNA sulfur modification protein DndD
LATVPELDAIAALLDERQKAIQRVEEARGRHKALEEEVQKIVRHCEHQQSVLAALMEKQVERDFLQEDASRIVFHSKRARKTLEVFSKELLHRHVKNISRLVLDSFHRLLRKQSLVSDLKINPETFSLDLSGSDGGQLSSERLSAGERQLLAVSILWGLARASGRALPAVIDTPLGRLDAYHRNQLIERYFPYASHQVILLSTDEEIDEEYYAKIRPWVGSSYKLEFDNERDGTTVQPGYFW